MEDLQVITIVICYRWKLQYICWYKNMKGNKKVSKNGNLCKGWNFFFFLYYCIRWSRKNHIPRSLNKVGKAERSVNSVKRMNLSNRMFSGQLFLCLTLIIKFLIFFAFYYLIILSEFWSQIIKKSCLEFESKNKKIILRTSKRLDFIHVF